MITAVVKNGVVGKMAVSLTTVKEGEKRNDVVWSACSTTCAQYFIGLTELTDLESLKSLSVFLCLIQTHTAQTVLSLRCLSRLASSR